MINLENQACPLMKLTIPEHSLYEWLILPDESNKYQQLWIKNITYPEMLFIEEYPNDQIYIPKIKEEVIKNHFEHIRKVDELDEIVETIQEMYYRITKIRGKEVDQ